MSRTNHLYISLCALPLLACTATLAGQEEDGSGGGSGSGSGSGPGSGAGGSTFSEDCAGTEVVTPKRLVRLTFNQLVNSIGNLFGAAVATTIQTDFTIPDATHRTFPPLSSPREGSVITDSVWLTADNISQVVAKHVFDDFATVTACTATPTDECGQGYVTTLAEKAYRRPLTDAERAALLGVYNGVKTDGGTVQDAVRYGVYAVLESPQFLYRTEFGTSSATEGALTPYEMADALAYFMADAPPDQELLNAARDNALSTPEQISAQVNRLLATPAVRANLEAATLAYFRIPNLETVVIDPAVAPDFTNGVRASMYRESELFIQDVLWNGPMASLLSSRKTYINTALAPLYGVTAPAGATADMFVAVDLPASRAGLLTSLGFLTATSRPDQPSVVGRGLAVNAAFLCAENPAFPEELKDVIADANTALAGKSEREKSAYRQTTVPCAGCHMSFDPYGVGLENFDVIGKYRTMDPEGRPIDASVTLPANAGGAAVTDAAGMADALASGGTFVSCMTKNFIAFALAEGSAALDSCATVAIKDRFDEGDKSFSSMIREIALSKTLGTRAPGAAQ